MNGENIPLGVALSMGAAAAFAFTAILIRPAVTSVGIHLGNLIAMTVGFLFIGAIILVVDRQALTSLAWTAFLWFALIGLLNFSLGRHFYFLSISKVGPSRASTAVAILPLVATFLALLFLDEKVTLFTLLGVLLVVGGITLVVRSQ